jgi:probable rRNA maturation factor
MIYVQVTASLDGDPDAIRLDSDALIRAARQALDHEQAGEELDLTLVLTDDSHMQTLNCQFRQVDAPTDVLAFLAGDADPDTQTVYLGDVMISLPRARLQAETGGHSLLAELQLLAVHGLLHLLGHDHASEAEKTAMWAAQAQILSEIGCPVTAPPP